MILSIFLERLNFSHLEFLKKVLVHMILSANHNAFLI